MKSRAACLVLLLLLQLHTSAGVVNLIIDTDMVKTFTCLDIRDIGLIGRIFMTSTRTLMLTTLEPCAPPTASSSWGKQRFWQWVIDNLVFVFRHLVSNERDLPHSSQRRVRQSHRCGVGDQPLLRERRHRAGGVQGTVRGLCVR